MTAQYLAIAFLLLMTAITLASAWKSLTTGKSQPASFVMERRGKQPILRSERPFAYWYHTLPWLILVPMTVVFTAWMIIATLTWPPCSATVKEQCLYVEN